MTDKMLPTVTDENRPFWDGARAGHLKLQACTECGHIRYPIQERCPRCLSLDHSWTTLSGRGEVFAKVVYHQAFNAAWKGDVPYNLVMVQLDEGPRMYSNVVGSRNDEIRVGDRLEAVYEQATEEVTIVRFRRV